MERGSQRRQVKPLAASLLDALDYNSSDDSDFEVGDASGSDGTGNGSDEEGSKPSAAGSESDSDNVVSIDIGTDEEEPKHLTAKDNVAEDEEKSKQQSSSDASAVSPPKGRRKSKKVLEPESRAEAGIISTLASEAGSDNADVYETEPKKWNFRRNRPLLDFTTMEELNEIDDYDSEDDNDWRPTAGKKRGKAATQKGGGTDEGDSAIADDNDGDDDEDDDKDDNDEDDYDVDDDGEDEDDKEDDEVNNSSSESDKEVKKPKKKAKNTNAFDEELTNDSMSQGKGIEDASLDRSQTWNAQHILICSVCLGDNSEDADEIIQCDNCGVTVHEGCYGVDGESDSIMSSASENSTEPWFCDACKNGVMPSCELCPNQDGIFKETDAGRWVHVVCALYVPGVAFGDIDKLRPVTLTEMNYSKYGAKECSFCEDNRFARTGVCISCDAGMCRSYFHVTCAQREGLLSEAAAEELCESLEELLNVNGDLRSEGQAMWTLLGDILGQKLNTPAVLKAPKERKSSKKEGGTQGKPSSQPAILYSCGICKKNQDQHLLVLCDTCKLYYHLGCLEPPLTRMPKKTKNSYWQCSECDQASSDEADIAMETLPDGTKRSRRQIKGPIKFIPQEMSPEPKKTQVRGTRTRGQKRKNIPFCEEREDNIEDSLPRERRQRQSAVLKKNKADDMRTECTTCKGPGDNENLVRCDECQLCYHFGCLDPPLKKSPKQAGYGWICQECDISSSKFLYRFVPTGVVVVLEPIPAIIEQYAGDTLNQLPANRRAHRDKQPSTFALTPRGSLECSICLPSMFLGCGRKPECPEKTHTGMGRTCKLHTGRVGDGIKPAPS
ncbi:PHD finger protein 14 isoform X10 [Syngnathus scovelli]|uniref:PHD finger protein 14 isoform X10 n=1 Tax=Syngnathus scovelli TaxID=161590 RepID=UPI0035CB9D7C